MDGNDVCIVICFVGGHAYDEADAFNCLPAIFLIIIPDEVPRTGIAVMIYSMMSTI